MALLKFLKGNYAGLNNAAIKEGQVLICGDTGEMFVDVAADKRVKIGDFITVANIAALEALDATAVPTSRLYYVEDGNILARSNGTTWVQVNKQKTADELKTMLGLGDLAYKSEVAETDLAEALATKINNKVDKVTGKSLVDDAQITKLAGVSEGANKVEKSETNGNIKIDGVETVVYTHPAKHQITDIEGLQDALDGKQGSGNFAAENHTHTKDQITDFAHTHIASEITDLDATIKTYNYATKTEAQGYADAKDDAIAAAKKAGDDAQAYAEGVAKDLADYETANDAALAEVKATADAAVTDAKLATALEPYAKTADVAATYETKTDAGNKLTEAKNYADGLNTAMNTRVEALEAVDHEHANKELLDTYTQTEADLADAVAKKHEHANKDVLDGITAAKVAAWDSAESNAKSYAKGYADGLIGSLGENETLVGKVTAEAEAREAADKALGERIDAHEALVGELPEGATATTVVGYVNEKVAAINSDAGDLADRVKAIEDDYLVEADKTELSNAIAAEKERAEGVEANLQTQINTIMNNPDTEGVINSINEFTQYITDHGEIAEGFRTDIDKNKEDIAANTKAIDDHEALAAETYETKTDAAAKLTEAKGYTDTEVAKDRARLDTLEGKVDVDKVSTAISTAVEGEKTRAEAKEAELTTAIEAAKTDASNKDAAVLAEAQNYADAAKDAAIADAATKYETIGTAQGIVDGLKLDETYEPIGAEDRAIAAAKTESENQVKALAGEGNTSTVKKNADDIATLFDQFQWGEF